LQASNERGKGLEEAKDILKFNEEVEKVEAWIREKVSIQFVEKLSLID
jgi:spectrin beta